MNDRGLLTGFDLDSLRQRRAQADFAPLWERLVRRTRQVMRLARDSDFTLETGALAWHSRTPMVREAALIWRLTDDADALDYVLSCVDRIAHDSQRTPGGRLLSHSHAEIALAADICRDVLPAASRAALLAAMRERFIDHHLGAAPYTAYSGGANIPLCQVLNAAICAITWGPACGHPD